MASLGLLVAGVAHELNNPTSYVHSNLELIEEYAERLAEVPRTTPAKADQTLRPVVGAMRVIGNPRHPEGLAGADHQMQGRHRANQENRAGSAHFSRTDDIGLIPVDLHEGIESTLNLLAKQYRNRIAIHRGIILPQVECHPTNQVNLAKCRSGHPRTRATSGSPHEGDCKSRHPG